MKKYWLLFALLLLLSGSSGMYADVILTDQQAEELEATLDELEKISIEQQTTINNLKKQNSELESHLIELEKQANDRQNLLNQQDETLKEAKSSSARQGIFSILRNILISLGIGIIGVIAGALLF